MPPNPPGEKDTEGKIREAKELLVSIKSKLQAKETSAREKEETTEERSLPQTPYQPEKTSAPAREKLLFDYVTLVNSMVHIIAGGDPQKVEELKKDSQFLLSTLREDYQSSRSQADQITALQAGLDDREQYLETLAREYPALEELKKMEQNALSLEDKLKELIQLKNALSTKVQQQETEISDLKSTNSHLKESSKALDKDYKTVVEESRKQQERNTALQTALNEKDQHLQDQLALYQKLEQATKKTEQELREKNTLLETRRASEGSALSDTRFALGRTQNELSEIKLKYSSLEEQLQTQQAELETEQRKNARSWAELGRQDRTISYLNQKKSQAENSVKSSEKLVKSLKRELKNTFRNYDSKNRDLIQQLNSERKETQRKAAEADRLEGRLTQLEEKLAQEKESRFYFPSFTRITHAAYKALLIGLLGGAAIIYSSQPSSPLSLKITSPTEIGSATTPPSAPPAAEDQSLQLAFCHQILWGREHELSRCNQASFTYEGTISTLREEKADLTRQNIRLNSQLAALETSQQKDPYQQFIADPSLEHANFIIDQYLENRPTKIFKYCSFSELEEFPDFVFADHLSHSDYPAVKHEFIQYLYSILNGKKVIQEKFDNSTTNCAVLTPSPD